jgi:hypothetical protein
MTAELEALLWRMVAAMYRQEAAFLRRMMERDSG